MNQDKDAMHGTKIVEKRFFTKFQSMNGQREKNEDQRDEPHFLHQRHRSKLLVRISSEMKNCQTNFI